MPDSHPVVSLVLRCLREPAADGRVVGQAEVVSTGERVPIREVDDLVDIVRRLAGEGGR